MDDPIASYFFGPGNVLWVRHIGRYPHGDGYSRFDHSSKWYTADEYFRLFN